MVGANGIGIVLVIVGVFATLWPYQTIRMAAKIRYTSEETGNYWSTSGSKPSIWVTMARIFGILTIFLGIGVVFGFVTI